jgi:hypothetical protein
MSKENIKEIEVKKAPEELLTTDELAVKFKKVPATIRNYRREGMPTATDNPILYDYDQCFAWLQKRGK